MERASQLLLNTKLGAKTGGEHTVAQAAWRAAVGKRLSALTHAAALEKGVLKVYVEDKVWESQLCALKTQILVKMRKVTGKALVEDLVFRVMPGRRGPQIETEVVRANMMNAAMTDEVRAIEDPMLRRIYQRKKA